MQSDSFTYSVEDTYEGCYRDIGTSLSSLGWNKLSRSKWKKKTPPLLQWIINEKDVHFSSLLPWQMCNHFEGISEITTKMGFCNLLREAPWIGEHPRVLSPRCYNIGDPVHREEFVDDFYLTAASAVLKAYILRAVHGLGTGSSSGSALADPTSNDVVLRHAIRACSWHLRIKLGGEWPDVDRTFDTFDGTGSNCEWSGLTTREVNAVLTESYCIARNSSLQWNSDKHLCFPVRALAERETRVLLVLQGLRRCNPQFDLDGMRNVWIVKAPDACQGVGLRVLHRLDEILGCERGMGGRTVQKYVETPLLAQPTVTLGGPGNELRAHVKFDLRVWVLVTSVTPLKAHIFSSVYGRCCSLPYNLSVEALGESLRHLTNYSIQRSSNGKDKEKDKDKVKELEKGLLMTHDEVVDVVAKRAVELRRYRPHQFWDARVWPAIKRKIALSLELAVSCGSLAHRDRSFEFLGVDVLLDERLRPWILEVNMSPAMAHRNAAQSKMIRTMARGLVDIAVTPFTGLPPVCERSNPQIVLEPGSGFTSGGGVSGRYGGYSSEIEGEISSDGESDLGEDGKGGEEGHWQVLVNKATPTPDVVCSSGTNTRPSSAHTAGRPRSSVSGRRAREAATDVTFAVTGVSVDAPKIAACDKFNTIYAKRSLLFAWMRRYLARTRSYHEERRAAATVVQCAFRCYAARVSLVFRRRQCAATLLQAQIRGLLGKFELHQRICRRAAVVIQALIRRYLARLETIRLRCHRAARTVQKWIRHRYGVYLRKTAFKIVWCAKQWVRKRKNYARRVIACVALHYRWRRRRHIVIQRVTRRWLVRRRQWRFCMLRTLRIRALEAKEGLRKMNQKRVKRLRREVAKALEEHFELPVAAQKSMLRKVKTEEGRPAELGFVDGTTTRNLTKTNISFTFPDDDLRENNDVGVELSKGIVEDTTAEGGEEIKKNKNGFLFDFVSRYNGALGTLRSALAQNPDPKDEEIMRVTPTTQGKDEVGSASADVAFLNFTDSDTITPESHGRPHPAHYLSSDEDEKESAGKSGASPSDLCKEKVEVKVESRRSSLKSTPKGAPELADLTDVEVSEASWSLSSPQSLPQEPTHSEPSGMRLELGLQYRHLRSSRSIVGSQSLSSRAGDYIYRDTWGNLRRRSDNKRVGTSKEYRRKYKASREGNDSNNRAGSGGKGSSRSGSRGKERVVRSANGSKGATVSGRYAKSSHQSQQRKNNADESCMHRNKIRRSAGGSESSRPSHSAKMRERIQAAAALGGLTGYAEAATTEARLRPSRGTPRLRGGGGKRDHDSSDHAHLCEPHPIVFRECPSVVSVPVPAPPPEDGWMGNRPMSAAANMNRTLQYKEQVHPSFSSSCSSQRRRVRPSTGGRVDNGQHSRQALSGSASFVPASTVGYGQSSTEQVLFDDVAYDKMRERALSKLRSPNNNEERIRRENYVPCPPEKAHGAQVSRPFEYELNNRSRCMVATSNTCAVLAPLDSPWHLDSPAESLTAEYQAQPFWF